VSARAARLPRGFSLIEIMVVLVVVALLASLALPGYRQFVNRSYRTDAIAQLMRVASCQERVRATHGAYDTGRCLPTAPVRYQMAYRQDAGTGFTVLARPVGIQSEDPCGTLILEHTGGRGVSAQGADVDRCWSGR